MLNLKFIQENKETVIERLAHFEYPLPGKPKGGHILHCIDANGFPLFFLRLD